MVIECPASQLDLNKIEISNYTVYDFIKMYEFENCYVTILDYDSSTGDLSKTFSIINENSTNFIDNADNEEFEDYNYYKTLSINDKSIKKIEVQQTSSTFYINILIED